MGFKRRVGNFLLLAGTIGLLVFVATLLAPASDYSITITAFLVGALLFGLGLNFRLSKGSRPPPEAAYFEPHSARPAAKSGPPPAGAKKQGLLNTIVKGPADRKKTAPAPPKPQAGGAGGGRPPGARGGPGKAKK